MAARAAAALADGAVGAVTAAGRLPLGGRAVEPPPGADPRRSSRGRAAGLGRVAPVAVASGDDQHQRRNAASAASEAAARPDRRVGWELRVVMGVPHLSPVGPAGPSVGILPTAMFQSIRPEELKRRIAGDSLVLLDVREAEELAIAKLDRVVHIPLSELAVRAGELDPEAEIVCICHHGMRSAHAASYLADRDRLINLTGGIVGGRVDPEMALLIMDRRQDCPGRTGRLPPALRRSARAHGRRSSPAEQQPISSTAADAAAGGSATGSSSALVEPPAKASSKDSRGAAQAASTPDGGSTGPNGVASAAAEDAGGLNHCCPISPRAPSSR